MNKQDHPRFTIQPMTEADIEAVIAIEQAAYGTHLPKRNYLYELRYNKLLAHYFVIRPAIVLDQSIIGGGGIWIMADEAHIITIAIHPTWQNHGLGAWLLLLLLEEGQRLGAITATLEVRPSNQSAISLYQKYGFEEVGRRPKYYHDNGEDALILTTPSLDSAPYQAMLAQQRCMLTTRLAQINFAVMK